MFIKKAGKSIYKILPLKKQLFTILRSVYSPSPSLYQHLTFSGDFKVQVDEEHDFKIKHYGFVVENEIFWKGIFGGWEKKSLEIWSKLCSNNNITVFDIGANTGVYSLLAKSMNNHNTVYAFEPIKRVYEKLKANAKLNNFDIICIEEGCSNESGTALINDSDAEHLYSASINNSFNKTTQVKQVEIKIITLDDFISSQKISRVDLIKIDVERHEAEVIKGAINTLVTFKPTILIEILDNEIASLIEAQISDLNYLYFNISETGEIRRTDHLQKSDEYNYLICTEEVAGFLKLN